MKKTLTILTIILLSLTTFFIPLGQSQSGNNFCDIARYNSYVILEQTFENVKLTDIEYLGFAYKTINVEVEFFYVYGVLWTYTVNLNASVNWQTIDVIDLIKEQSDLEGFLNTEYIYGIGFESDSDMSDFWLDDVSLLEGANEIILNNSFEGAYVPQVSIEYWDITATYNSFVTVYTFDGSTPTPTPEPTVTPTPTLTITPTPTPITSIGFIDSIIDNIMLLVYLIIIFFIFMVIIYLYLLLRRRK